MAAIALVEKHACPADTKDTACPAVTPGAAEEVPIRKTTPWEKATDGTVCRVTDRVPFEDSITPQRTLVNHGGLSSTSGSHREDQEFGGTQESERGEEGKK